MTPTIKALAKKAKKSDKEADKIWKEAIKVTEETFGIKEKDFKDKQFAYAVGVAKKMMGLKETTLDVDEFMKYKGTVSEFLKEKLISEVK